MLKINSQGAGEPREGWGINPVMKRHLELEIKTLQNAPRDVNKLERLLKAKQREKKQQHTTEDIEDIHKKVGYRH